MIADEFQRVGDGIFFWEAYEPSVKTDLSCCAVRTPEGLVFIDPIPLAAEALEELLEEAAPVAIVVTNENHQRASEAFRKRLGIPVLAGLSEGEVVGGELQVFEIVGAVAGEVALWSPGRSLHFGDAVINLPPHGLAPLPAKYCLDHAALLRSLERLATLEARVVTFAHGLPICGMGILAPFAARGEVSAA